MNAERLLAHFEQISEAPDAIARLRRFILDLAVRGKLVEQDPEDEPVEDLLQLIAVEKTSRRSARARSTPDERVEGWCSIPASWNFVRLDKVSTVIMGSSPPGSTYNKTGDGVPLINGPVEFTPGPFGRTTINQYTTDPSAFCEEGDFLVCVRGSTTGRTNIAAFRACIGRGVAAIQPMFEDKFIRLAIRVRQEAILQMGRGIAFPSISREQLSGLPIPLPPLAEQHRIVAKVDELMALCDQLEASRQEREQGRERLMAATLQRLNEPAEDPASFRKDASFALQVLPSISTTPAQIKQLRQTILNLAVRGKLVEQDPEDEPAEELLACFAEAKVEQKKRTGDARIKLEDDPSPDDLPWAMPAGWMCQSFQNLFLFIDYRGNTPPKTTEGVPLITAKNVRMGRLDREPQEFVSQSTFETWMTRGFPRAGDLFFTTEAPLGNVCLNKIEEPFALAQRVICLQPYASTDTSFIMFALMSDLMQTIIGEHATGLTAKGIKAAKLKPLPIPLPPLAEQHRIVAKVDELMALCDQLEQQLSQVDQQRKRLLEAVLDQALSPMLAAS